MTDHKNKLIIGTSVVLALLLCVFIAHHRGRLSSPVRVAYFNMGKGWGYDILVRDTIFIHQPYKPAVQGQQAFETKAQAARMANAMIQKMNRKNSPSLTTGEVETALAEKQTAQ